MQNRSARLRRNRRKSSAGFIVPFLIILLVGIVLVLGFNLLKLMFSTESAGSASMHIESGSVDLRTWGTDDFFKITLDTKIRQGDEIKTSDNAIVLVEMFDGSILRFSGGSDVVFEEINEDELNVKLLLVDGNVWINKVYKSSNTLYDIKMNNLEVSIPKQTIISISTDTDRYIAVISGDDVNVDVFDRDTGKVVDSVEIGIGQQAIFSDAVMERFWKYQSPNVLLGITDEFKASDWYKSNLLQDAKPVVTVDSNSFEVVDPVLFNDDNCDDKTCEEKITLNDVEDIENLDNVENSDIEDLGLVDDSIVDLSVKNAINSQEKKAPLIKTVNGVAKPGDDGVFFVDVGLATLKGTVSGAKSVTVNGYTLSKFNEGDEEWTYYANADHRLMVPGENTYDVYATYMDGTRSEITHVKILFEQKFKEEVITNTDNTDDEPVTDDSIDKTVDDVEII